MRGATGRRSAPAINSNTWYEDLLDNWLSETRERQYTWKYDTPRSEVPCCAFRVPPSTIYEWLIDTGCGHDLVEKSDVAALASLFRPAPERVVFDTAGGEVPADKAVSMHTPAITQQIEPYVLDSTPTS